MVTVIKNADPKGVNFRDLCIGDAFTKVYIGDEPRVRIKISDTEYFYINSDGHLIVETARCLVGVRLYKLRLSRIEAHIIG